MVNLENVCQCEVPIRRDIFDPYNDGTCVRCGRTLPEFAPQEQKQ